MYFCIVALIPLRYSSLILGLTVGPERHCVPSILKMSATVPVKKAWDHAVAAAFRPAVPVRAVIPVPTLDADATAVQHKTLSTQRHPIAMKRFVEATYLFSHLDGHVRLRVPVRQVRGPVRHLRLGGRS